MTYFEYNRSAAIAYAKRWALSRNPQYYDYSNVGGDCTSFISQCVYAGSGIMNYTKDFGWYYIDANNKSPSWTGVQYFYNFMTQNQGVGPYGETAALEEIEVGDIIQLGDRAGNYYHTLILTAIREDEMGKRYYICAHTIDSYQRNLSTYDYYNIRCIHILGVRADTNPENNTENTN